MKNKLKTYMVMLPISAMTIFVSLPKEADAQIAVAEVIDGAIKRVIKAVDLKVQRLQNQTIWLQNAQKVLENQLSKLKLGEIADWTDKQKKLYEQYYQELWQVKSALAYYKRVKELTQTQVSLLNEYRWAWGLFRQDKHFSAEELEAMRRIYAGLLDASLKNLDQLLLVSSSLKTQLSDAERLQLMDETAQAMAQNYSDLKQYNAQNISLSIQRAKSLDEAATLKELYGIH